MPIASLARDTVFDTTDSGHSVLPPHTNSTDTLTIGVLATELLEHMRDHHIPHHPLQTSAFLTPHKAQSITHAILDLTGFPISKSREANGLSVPTGNDVAIAKTFVTAATLAFEAVRNNSDIIRALGAADIHKEWIRATAESAISSARHLIGKGSEISHDESDSEGEDGEEKLKSPKRISLTEMMGPFIRHHPEQHITLC